ncbi:MAG: hypothetical protein WC307_03955 [Candidatus Nanoarchaeia archaeon]
MTEFEWKNILLVMIMVIVVLIIILVITRVLRLSDSDAILLSPVMNMRNYLLKT